MRIGTISFHFGIFNSLRERGFTGAEKINVKTLHIGHVAVFISIGEQKVSRGGKFGFFSFGGFFEVDPTDPRRQRGAWNYGTTPDHYGQGLMWAIVRGHAPMTPGTIQAHDPAAPYWAAPPDLTAPVTVPPRWFNQ